MKYIKRILQLFRILLFAFMISVCMVLGVVPIIPKRKEQPEIEIKMEDADQKINVNDGSGEVKKIG